MAIRSIGFIKSIVGSNVCLSDANIVAANATTDTDFTMGVGRKADTAGTGAVGTTKSLFGYIKQLVTLLLGSQPGALKVIHKGSTITPGTSAVDLTGTASGAMYIENVSVQKITANQAAGLTSLALISDDTAALNLVFKRADGQPLQTAELVVGSRWTVPVNWKLATGKKLQAITTGTNGTAGYLWTIEARALDEGATLATA